MLKTIVNSFDIWGTAQTQKSKGRKAGSDNISLHGINKLRELILKLAVRGKLVPQDFNDEPANELLQKIANKKEKLIEEGEIKLQKISLEEDANQIEYSIPGNWEWANMHDILYRISNGYSGKQNNNGKGYPISRIETISNSTVNFDKVGFCTSIPKEKLNYYKLQKGDILLSHINSDFHVGKTAVMSGNQNLYHGVNLLLLRFSPDVLSNYIDLYINSLRLSGYFIQIAQHAIGQSSINQKKIITISIPIPPLAEQHRIVAKVDELTALCDKLEQEQMNHIATHLKLVEALLKTLTDAKNAEELKTAWQHLEPHFDILFTTEESVELLKQTVLQLAVMGKLTSSWRTSHPELVSGSNSASALLEKIAAEKQRLIKEGKLKKQKPLPEITEAEKPFELPEGWEWSRLNDFIDVRDGTHDSPKNAVGSNTIPLITSKNFNDGEIDFNGARRISEADHIEISKRSNVEKYDILFSMIGGNLGNQVIVMSDEEFSVKNVALFKYYDKNLSFPFFIKRFMEHLALDLQKKAIGGAQPFVSLGFLRKLVIGVPPTEEQHRITDKLEDLMSLCDQLKERIIATQELKVKLADAVVEQAVKTKPEKVYEVSNSFDMAAEPGPGK